MRHRIGVALIVALVLSLGLFGIASAHADLVSSDPAAGANLTAAPAKVTLVFSEEISDETIESFFTVTDASGAEVGKGELDNTDLDHKTLSGALKSGLGDGVYTVTWQVITPDDDGKSEGSFKFGVNADPGAQPTAAAHDEPTAAPAAAAPTTVAKPTAAAGAAAPANLPKTAESGPNYGAYLLAGATILLAGGFALRRAKRSAR